LDALYTAWIAAGRLSSEDNRRLRSNTEQLKHLYEEHIQVEETVVFPRAVEILNPQVIAAIGQEFHARRK
jgi:hemerythrin-like domain-containing protein